MLIATRKKKSGTVMDAAWQKGSLLQLTAFVALIISLILWSYYGKKAEQIYYHQSFVTGMAADRFGAELTVSPYGNGLSDIIITHITPHSSADRSGLKIGDQVNGLDGRMVTSLPMALSLIESKATGENVTVTIQRGGQVRDVAVHLVSQKYKDPLMKTRYMSLGKRILVGIVFLKLLSGMFFLIYKNIVNRTYIVLFFAVMVVSMGTFFGVYTPVDAFFSIKFNTISLLLGMSLVSAILDQTGFFDDIAYRIYSSSNHSYKKIFIIFCLTTYVFSLLVNNLTTILIIVPMTLNLAAILRFDPRDLIIAEVISSNLGGASTMVGDFPNMLISAEAGVGFNSFIVFMMPLCMILFCILLLFLNWKVNLFQPEPVEKSNRVMVSRPKIVPAQRRAKRRALFILFHMIFLFSISRHLSLNPSAIALFGGLSLFLFSGMDKGRIINQMGFSDLIFFMGLFIVVGSLEASGIVHYVAQFISTLSLGKPWLSCLLLMWSAALLTAFLSAGPTTALFFPVVLGMGIMPAHHVIWWSLSLGVLAGSSATVMGATAGPVATSLLERFSSELGLSLAGGNTIPYGRFTSIGLPVMFIFLGVSSIYVLWLCLVM